MSFSVRPRKGSLLALVFAVFILTVPTAALAGPNALYYSGHDPSWGTTLEDDGAIARTPGQPLDGLENRVTFPGATPGDGGRFLDSRVAQGNGQLNLYVAQFASDVTSRPDLLFPGPVVAVAWYGEWNDLDGDGAIDDIHDDVGSGADEFVWRGRSSGNDVAMPIYVHPVPKTFPAVVGGNAVRFHGFSDGEYRRDTYDDFTDAEEQVWINDPAVTWAITPGLYDASILVRLTVITAADAIQDSGHPLRYNVDSPDALLDVDLYEALSPEVEGLYTSFTAALNPTVDAFNKVARESYAEAQRMAADVVALTDPFTRALAGDAVENAGMAIRPAFPKEPNHIFDDYGGHALFGGVGDTLGSYNSYDGYQSDVHFFVDAFGEITIHPTVHANTGAGPEVYVQRDTLDFSYSFAVPDDGSRPHPRQATAIFGVNADVVAWMDRNGDGFRGAVCDPSDPNEWDAARNTCRNPRTLDGRFDPVSGDGSGASLCRESAKGSVLVLPLDGEWTGAFLVRDYERYSNVVWNQNWEVLLGSEPVTLEWRPCLSNSSTRTRDVIVFPAGNPTVTIATSVTMTSGEYVDASGIRRPSETVTDFDVYHPTL